MMTRFSNLDRQNLKWAGRMALILVLTAVAEGLVGAFAKKPFPWVGIIPALMPLLACFFVIFPMIRAEKTDVQGI
jgi:hypothetical protein